jgi:hypothetical protein
VGSLVLNSVGIFDDGTLSEVKETDDGRLGSFVVCAGDEQIVLGNELDETHCEPHLFSIAIDQLRRFNQQIRTEAPHLQKLNGLSGIPQLSIYNNQLEESLEVFPPFFKAIFASDTH